MTVDVNCGEPLHVVFGYRLNVIVPVGLNPLDRVAVSTADPPLVRVVVEGLTVVVMLGPADCTVRTSPLSPHAPLVGLLLESPL